MIQLTIVTSLPSRKLQPNARTFWREKARLTAEARRTAGADAIAALNGADKPLWSAVTCGLWFRLKKKSGGGVDPDNLLAWAKPLLDGIADAGVVSNDRGMIHLPPKWEYGHDDECVVVTIRPTQPPDREGGGGDK